MAKALAPQVTIPKAPHRPNLPAIEEKFSPQLHHHPLEQRHFRVNHAHSGGHVWFRPAGPF